MTFLLDTIRLGLTNLRLRLLRSILTALGIILGVAAVITMVALGEGSKRDALAQIDKLGARNIIISSQKPPESTKNEQQRGFVSKYGLTRDDLRVIQEAFPDAEAIVPLKEIGNQVLRGDKKRLSQSFGTTPDLLKVAKLGVAKGGRYITQQDMDQQAMVCVIGKEIARLFFPIEDPVGQSIKIDDKAFTIIGVLREIGVAGGSGAALIGRNWNFDVHIPMTTAKLTFGDVIIRRQAGSVSRSEVQLSGIYISCPTQDRVPIDHPMLARLLQVRHDKVSDYAITVPYELLEAERKTRLTWNLVLGAIAGISLLVGGIGIMNIMLASVTERTREIGIRRAVGATQRHILWQFLVETGVLTALGGLMGVGLGIGLSVMVGWIAPKLPHAPFIGEYFPPNTQLPTHVTLWSIILAFTVAAATGLVFGIYPARRAARQDPIVALRHD
ncbi:MAG: ABC transporter permease [Phycisphaerales bacterium]|nr:ABC transporter permease [Phycisphaerales bacterium]